MVVKSDSEICQWSETICPESSVSAWASSEVVLLLSSLSTEIMHSMFRVELLG
jgi:hypothetical protein